MQPMSNLFASVTSDREHCRRVAKEIRILVGGAMSYSASNNRISSSLFDSNNSPLSQILAAEQLETETSRVGKYHGSKSGQLPD